MRRNKRRGFSLIEVATVLGISTIIAGLAIGLVHVSMQKTHDGQKHLATQNTIARLAETFRRDVHAAATILEEPVKKQGDADAATRSTWLLTRASGNAVRYQLEPGRLLRSVFASPDTGKENSKNPVSQDSFELPTDIIISIQLDPPSNPRIATLFISPGASGSESRPIATKSHIRPLRIDAAVSTDARFDTVATRNNTKAAKHEETKK